jgi:hypothetical protein
MTGFYGPAMDGTPAGGTYETVIAAVLDDDWSAWFGELDITTVGTMTMLRGTVTDQAALHGLLGRIRDLGVPLVAVRHIETPTNRDACEGEVGPPDGG